MCKIETLILCKLDLAIILYAELVWENLQWFDKLSAYVSPWCVCVCVCVCLALCQLYQM